MKDYQFGDRIAEQLLSRKRSTGELVAVIAIWLVGGLLTLSLLLMGLIGKDFMDPESIAYLAFSTFSPFFLVAAIGAGYFTWFLAGKFDREFEYTLTNGELDVDLIVAKRKRMRLISVTLSKVEGGGKWTKEQNRSGYDLVVDAAAEADHPDNRYLIYRHPKKGKVLLIFTPNQTVCGMMKSSLPHFLLGEFVN